MAELFRWINGRGIALKTALNSLYEKLNLSMWTKVLKSNNFPFSLIRFETNKISVLTCFKNSFPVYSYNLLFHKIYSRGVQLCENIIFQKCHICLWKSVNLGGSKKKKFKYFKYFSNINTFSNIFFFGVWNHNEFGWDKKCFIQCIINTPISDLKSGVFRPLSW